MRIKLCGLIACAAMLAAGVVSCQQHDDIPQGVKYPILFDSPDTRAVADLDNLKEGFKVYAYVDGNVGSTSFAKDVVYNADNNVWAFESPEYWLPNTTYSFKAFYPAILTAGTLVVDQTKSAQDFTITGFDAVNHQQDIMVASAEAKVESGAVPTPTDDVNGSVVKLSFQHLLACIEIKMKSAISNVEITNITLQDVGTNATYTSADGKWTAEEKGSISLSPGNVALNSNEFVPVTGDGILVVPGAVSGVKVRIETNINKTYEVEVPAITWYGGNKYTYTAEVKQSNIIFNEPKVDEWDSENATGSVIIK